MYMINGSVFIILGVICYLIVRGILIGTKNTKHVICNVLGSIFGYCIYNIFLKAINKFNIRVLGKTNSKGVELVDK
ncbi:MULTISPECIES: hypothetical protein [Bacillus cereus group]|uniref:Uncharacterized protein n=1 Tax=Bacillus thuringiensis subsp. medellin TaxID=79672 RepID=A0A9X6NHW3_BACTV|nr:MULTISPECIES: hypothetical protein [Bacillus cereus group]MCR6787334.1 hypothetical protein [Bacillus thuringiensis]MCR6822981.1 hypothetical protein [Bacillus thuringiensis]MCR6829410.1 hypothetical protein [Bacillus thuringiensis]MEB8932526.1 hypothetical protein [Bacillus cereus]MEB9326447.1 hypothetical protein [Bacillus cereus]